MLDVLLAVLDLDYSADLLPYVLAEQFQLHGLSDPADLS